MIVRSAVSRSRELAGRQRLRDVVVRAELEPDHLVEASSSRAVEHDDRHRVVRAQAAADLEPVELREHDVEHDEIDRLTAEALERRLSRFTKSGRAVSVGLLVKGADRVARPSVISVEDKFRLVLAVIVG